jgi:hypothetical protein
LIDGVEANKCGHDNIYGAILGLLA